MRKKWVTRTLLIGRPIAFKHQRDFDDRVFDTTRAHEASDSSAQSRRQLGSNLSRG